MSLFKAFIAMPLFVALMALFWCVTPVLLFRVLLEKSMYELMEWCGFVQVYTKSDIKRALNQQVEKEKNTNQTGGQSPSGDN